ncbi:GntR family transcriptional regulator [Robertmurraya sp. DFI.2.37]|uniref:GntR family transcriptional regulator n=1 Tax=Robertmurraya sp. DFI.2.37 TaxID=3031819 RepID=UPI001245D611|nr:GntR family transcriptional regulator [Robertmurraya sp. DFI.2.37]
MTWEPNRASKKPLYKQIAEYVENNIADGAFPSEKSLPSGRVFAKELKVNRSTVVAAYDELQAGGFIQSIQGSGTMISKDIWRGTKKRIPSWHRYIESGPFLPNLPVTQRLRREMEEKNLINLASYVRFTYARARVEEIREGVRRFAEALTSLKK